MRRTAVAFVAMVALLATACQAGEYPSSATPAPTPPRLPPSSSEVTFEVWFGYGDWLFVTERTALAAPRVGQAAVEALLGGPTDEERSAGVGTSIPEGTELLGLVVSEGVATVDLTREFESGGGSLSMLDRLAQLTYTLTQFPTVRGVNLESEGEPVTVFGGEGIILDRPMTRRSFLDRLPPILVESPHIGDLVSSPISVSGTANVFEATVSISILDAEGREIVSAFTLATCGTGCRGRYSENVPYTVDQSQPGIVRVYEVSAMNGEAINVIEIPVILGA